MAQELCNEICVKESVEENTQKFMNLKSAGHDVKTFAIKNKTKNNWLVHCCVIFNRIQRQIFGGSLS